MRVLVTGSRAWRDVGMIENAISEAWLATGHDEPFVVVHGACAKGADMIADRFARDVSWTVERHPADWDKHGKRAGMIRNAEMVSLGADVCLAFIKDRSRGASHCADLAERSGIPVRRYRA